MVIAGRTLILALSKGNIEVSIRIFKPEEVRKRSCHANMKSDGLLAMYDECLGRKFDAINLLPSK